jgi:tetratricopeptide (TPR) repeat protein
LALQSASEAIQFHGTGAEKGESGECIAGKSGVSNQRMYAMRRSIPTLAAALLPLLFVMPAAPQTSNGAGGQNPETLTADYNQAMQSKDWSRAVATAQQLAGLKATSVNLKMLANAQLYSGSADAALATYDQALAAAQQEKPAGGQPMTEWKNGLSQIYIGKGNALLKLKRTAEAIEAYNQSAGLAANAGLAYFNLCAVLYNIGKTQESAAACRKCVQADPARANAWFILGSDLFADSPFNSKGEVIASPETREALEKYLALAPDGPHAADVKAMLQMIAK